MKVVLFHAHGGAEVLEYTGLPISESKPGEALIHLRAARSSQHLCERQYQGFAKQDIKQHALA